VVVSWIVGLFENPEPPLSPNIKTDRGFEHDLTGRLLCPIEYDWADPWWVPLSVQYLLVCVRLCDSVRQNIRDGQPEFIVTANSWPSFLYPHAKANHDDVQHGLFQSAILVKVLQTRVAQHAHHADCSGIQIHFYIPNLCSRRQLRE
jgi:hypothetical protein